jgi:elongation factor P
LLEVTVTHIRPGQHIQMDRGIWLVTNYEHVKPGKGGAFVRIKIKNVQTGAALEKTLDGDARVQQVETIDQAAQFLYRTGDACTFMNLETYDQVELPVSLFPEQAGFLKESIEVKLTECEGRILGVKFPTTVTLKVIETPPGVKGDTVTRGTKQATLETGHVANVPLFINAGDILRIDTRTGDYVERA